MDRVEAAQVLLRIACHYLDIFADDLLLDENQEEYLEILQAMEVMRNG